MTKRPANDGKLWTRDELVIAFELYCRTPFQRTKANNPQVQRTALLLGRTPASIARKLGNFGAFDPQLRNRGISGLSHAGHLDREVWEEFHRDWNSLVEEAYRLRQSFEEREAPEETINFPSGPTERLRVTRERIHQTFFREAVLSSYESRCCITGIALKECLVASHIVPWSRNEQFRTDPTNGLSLSATFDRLFDAGFLTLTVELKVQVSQKVRAMTDQPCQTLITCYHGKPILRPRRFAPSPSHLAWHRDNVFCS